MKVKELLLEEILDEDLKRMHSHTIDGPELDGFVEQERGFLKNKNVLIYNCRVCGDPSCGGIRTLIEKQDGLFTWTFESKEGEHQLKFNE